MRSWYYSFDEHEAIVDSIDAVQAGIDTVLRDHDPEIDDLSVAVEVLPTDAAPEHTDLGYEAVVNGTHRGWFDSLTKAREVGGQVFFYIKPVVKRQVIVTTEVRVLVPEWADEGSTPPQDPARTDRP